MPIHYLLRLTRKLRLESGSRNCMDPLSIAGQDQIEGLGGFDQNWSVHVPGDQITCFQSGGLARSGSIHFELLAECITLSALSLLRCPGFSRDDPRAIVQQPVAQIPCPGTPQQTLAYTSSSWPENLAFPGMLWSVRPTGDQ